LTPFRAQKHLRKILSLIWTKINILDTVYSYMKPAQTA